MKKITEPSVEIIRLPEEDIITTSGDATTNKANGDNESLNLSNQSDGWTDIN